MKIQFEIPDAVFKAAQRYTLDPVQHAVGMFDHWAQLAQQQHPGEDVLELPTLADKAIEVEKQQKIAQEEAAIAATIKKAEDNAQAEVDAKKQAEQRKQDALELLKDPVIFAAMMKAQGIPTVAAPVVL